MRYSIQAMHKPNVLRWTLLGTLLALANIAQAGQQDAGAQRPERQIHPSDSFTFCTVEYTSERGIGPGSGWSSDFPHSGHDFMLALEKLTRIEIVRDERDAPKQATVKLTDEASSAAPPSAGMVSSVSSAPSFGQPAAIRSVSYSASSSTGTPSGIITPGPR